MWEIVAEVRQVGAIGIFYRTTFRVAASSEDHAKEVWFAEHSKDWELHHFVSVKHE